MLERSLNGDNAPPIEPLGMSRAVLRRSFVTPLSETLAGPIAELHEADAEPCLYIWDDPSCYARTEPSRIEPLAFDPTETNEKIACVVWLFGPERVCAPDEMLGLLRARLSNDGMIVVSTECPWRGKILAPDEHAEQTDEEAAASLVRTGFGSIERHVDGPFFRLWSARLDPGSAHDLLSQAAAMLEERDHAAAERILSTLDERLSADGVREFGLLVAACHDMAGRRELAMEALTQILDMDPGCARALCGLGRLAALEGDLEKAGALFDKALTQQPALVAALRGKAAVAEARGDVNGAYASVLAASDLRPTDDHLLVEAVRLGRACGKLAQTDRFLRDIAARRPLSPIVSAIIGNEV
ncbi:MAG: hypothetical protein MUC50_11820 [Myxococcota bacterium]|jgi:hypothetical protein|nr:hypothetical protein [Myxococcota bacterium]